VTETALKQKVMAYCKHQGLFAVKIAGGARQRAGISDILIFLPPRGRLLALELKAPGKINETTPLQRSFLARVTEAGGFGVVADSVDSACEVIAMAVTNERVAQSS
jgi:hypothetical protein